MLASEVAEGDLIQVVPKHYWGGAILIVSEIKPFGVQAYLRIPANDGTGGDAYIRLKWEDFEPIGAKAIFAARRGHAA